MGKKRLPTSARGETVRGDIIDAANRLFYHRGYNQTSFTDIAEVSGVPRGNFYYYFKNKDEILGAVIDFRVEHIRAMLADWDAVESDPRQRLKWFTQMIRGSEKDLLRYGCPMGSLNIELGKAQPALKARARKMFDLFIDWLTRQLTSLEHADAAKFALQIMGRAQGIAVMAQVYGDREFMRSQLAEFDAWIESLPG